MTHGADTDFLLVPGAGGRGWYWHLVVAELLRRGYRAVAVDLPGADPAAGLPEYRDLIVSAACAFGRPVTLVAQSLGGFSAPLACEHVPVARLVLVNAMIPRPGETAGEWWDNVGWHAEAQAAADRDGRPAVDVSDLDTLFYHDLPASLVEVMRSDPEAAAEGPAIFAQPWPLAAWPDVPTEVLSGRDDRFFPFPLQQRVARQRLGLESGEIPGGHLAALSHPAALAGQITRASALWRTRRAAASRAA
jgi:pimeloyl-ACP methyl ester carboxylesterase